MWLLDRFFRCLRDPEKVYVGDVFVCNDMRHTVVRITETDIVLLDEIYKIERRLHRNVLVPAFGWVKEAT